MENSMSFGKPKTLREAGIGHTLFFFLLVYLPLAVLVFSIWQAIIFSAWNNFWLNAPGSYLVGATATVIGVLGSAIVERLYNLAMRSKGKTASPPPPWIFWPVLILVLLPLGVICGNVVAHSLMSVFYPVIDNLPGPLTWIRFRDAYFTGAIIVAVIFGWEIIRTVKKEKKAVELKLVQTQNERMRAQLKALQSQTNPHLLFNSLNTIASFIPSDPEAAEEMTVELADLLRAVLEASREAHHSLANEISICRDYLKIEKRRFQERLVTEIRVSEAIEVDKITVPVLILQPLVENAIKYAIAPRANGGRICIEILKQNQTIEIIIEDDGPGIGRSTAEPGVGTGIENTRKRLELEWNSSAGLELVKRKSGGTRAVVRLPWHKGQIDGTIEK